MKSRACTGQRRESPNAPNASNDAKKNNKQTNKNITIMKKVLLSILAVAAMASCVQSEDVNPQQLIDFGSPFVGGTTKAIDYSYGANNLLNEIYVYGSLKGTAANPVKVFDYTCVSTTTTNETVADDIYGDDKVWQCETPKYWVKDADYKFVALAGVAETAVTKYALPSVDAYLPSKITFAGNGKTDLLLSAVGRSNAKSKDNETVKFAMQHLLSKVKFTFNATTLGDNYYQVTDIKIANAYTQGNCAISYTGVVDDSNWAATTTWTTTGVAGVDFGHATNATTESAAAANIGSGASVTSNYDHLVVPCDYPAGSELQVSFKLALYDQSGVEINIPTEKTAKVAINLQSGFQYNFIVNLESQQLIDFTVSGAPAWDSEITDPVVSGTFN